ncbi:MULTISPECIES: DUF4330 domain-containing protein [Tepidanaerobacter]|uniref:DUF4330 domain-containing protein n=1 Tax=Tepidanaerobacter syntrophicus TaxID=224999 RepID=A0A0U9HEX9_9FIRM|nr:MULTISPECIES: DUF4330 domain-containing protein [Tepidanaerobacter]GAQ25062.1 hypothetical protein TSYNT_780 [Tepidanaerobacter syntrophicus]GLI50627.1 hypothetical protein TSYNTROOL_07130 [Tepidanaerobacter syntrophicus]HHV82843.1 DUF4330 domain-containing protein [Tepidanaerobacter syntrophicus]
MHIIDNKGRIFGLINIIDLLVILVILAVVARFGTKIHQSSVGSQAKDIEAVLYVKEVKDATADVIKVGDTVKETKTNGVLGKVTNVEVKPSETLVETADGRIVVYPNPVLKDVYITVKGTGSVNENAIVLGSNEIRIGTSLQIKTNIYSVTSTVMEINF